MDFFLTRWIFYFSTAIHWLFSWILASWIEIWKKKSCISIHSDYLLELDYLGRNHVISCTHYGLSYVKKTIYIYSVVIINVCVESFSLLHNFMAFIDMLLLLFLFRSLIRFNDFSAFIIKLVITIYRIEICQWINSAVETSCKNDIYKSNHLKFLLHWPWNNAFIMTNKIWHLYCLFFWHCDYTILLRMMKSQQHRYIFAYMYCIHSYLSFFLFFTSIYTHI